MPRARKLPAQDRRRQIIASAREVFAAQSYAKVGTADLAKAAGISEPALYRYFSSKKELYISTLKAAGARLRGIWQRIIKEGTDPLEGVWTLGMGYYDHIQSR